MVHPMEDRLTKVETQLAHTERICEQLDEVVVQLSRDADENRRQIKRLQEQIKALKAKLEDFGPAADEKPPHY